MSAVQTPRIVPHAKARWWERSGSDRSPTDGWRSACRVTALERELCADEVRYHVKADVVFVRRGLSVTGALAVDEKLNAEVYRIVRNQFDRPGGDR